MNQIYELSKINWNDVFVAVVLFLVCAKLIWDLCDFFKKKLRIKMGFEEDKEELIKRIEKLESHDNWQYEEISKISSMLSNICDSMKEKEERDRERIVVSFAADLYSMHDKFVAQGYTNRAGLETFVSMSNIYLAANGNHLIKEKIIPEVMNLPIRD